MSKDEANPKAVAKKKSAYKISAKRIKLAGLLCLIVAAVSLLLLSPLFRIHTISVSGNVKNKPEAVITASGIQKGINIFNFDSKKATDKLAKLDYVSSAVITRKLPGKVIIAVNEKSECAFIAQKVGFIGIDEQGKVLVTTSAGPKEVPLISGIKTDPVQNGDYIRLQGKDAKKKLSLLLRILAELKNQNIVSQIRTIDIKDLFDIHLTLQSDTLVNLGSDGEDKNDKVEYKIAYLKAVITELNGQRGGIIELTDTDNVTSRAQ